MDGATDTTANTLRWTILFLLENPECQDKIANEIKAVMGRSIACCYIMHDTVLKLYWMCDILIGASLSSMDHRDSMPYTCSFIDEVFRSRPAFPISMLHKALETFESSGYTVPKGTTVISLT